MSDFVTSILTPQGTNAALGSAGAQGQVQGLLLNLLKAYAPMIQQQMQFQQSQQPIRQASITGLENMATQPNILGTSANIARNTTAEGVQGANSLAGSVAGGTDSALYKGALVNAANQGTRAGNDYTSYMQSPEGMAHLHQAILGLSSMGNPDFSSLSGLAGGVYGRPQVQVQQSPLSGTLGALTGAWAASPSGFGGGKK